MIPDAEAVVAAYLNDHPDIVGLQARVATMIPKNFSRPWVRVTWLDAPDRSHGTEHLIDSLMQFDCYAAPGEGGSMESSLLARTVRAALHDLRASSPDGVVVTDVRFVGMLRRPDTDLEPARERVVLSAEIDMHPASGGS